MINAFKHSGQDGMVKVLEDMKPKGRIRFSSGGVGNDIKYIIELPSEKGRRLRLVTDRTLAFAELHQGTRSSDYTVGALELELTGLQGHRDRTTRLQADGEQKEATGRDRDLSIPLEAFEPEEVCEKMSRATLRN